MIMRITFSRIIVLAALVISLFGAFGISTSSIVYAEPAEEEEQERETVDLDQAQDPASAGCGDDCGLVEKYATPFLNFLGAIVGLVVTISIVVGGIQYASSADDPSKVAAAKKRILNAVIALVAFLFLYGFLQWLVPGGFI